MSDSPRSRSWLLHPYVLNVLYVGLVLLAVPWIAFQALTKGKYREGFAAKLLGLVPRRRGQRPCVWLHAVSVGEVNLLATLIEEIHRQRPNWECVISTTTLTGYTLAKRKYDGLSVFYCPLDFSWAVRTAMRRVRPQLLVLAELELWPNLIRAAGESGAQVAIVNGRLSQRSYDGYAWIRRWISQVLQQIDLIAVQDEEYGQRFRLLGAPADQVHVTGSMKYDGAQTDRDNPKTRELRALAGFQDDDLIFLAGSTQEPEESLALAAFFDLKAKHPRLRLILVPRHPDRFAAVAGLLENSGLRWQRRSELGNHRPDPKARVLLVDAVGELGAWWGTAHVAFVGGSMGSRGGQNMIEPAAYGAAVCFGPHTRNFRDIVALMLHHRAASVVQDGKQLTAFVQRALEDQDFAINLGRRAKTLVASQLGATTRTVELLTTLVNDKAPATKDRRAA